MAEKVTYGGRFVVSVDRCPECAGIWLDAGELEAIRDVIAADGEQAASGKFARGLLVGMVLG